jgi:hypothetical protein
MVERICPECQHGNVLENRYCGRCGASLDRNQIEVHRDTGLTIAGHQLPARQLKQVGQAVVVSLAALAAEAGLAWLRRRVEQINLPPKPTVHHIQPVAQPTRTAIAAPQQQTPGVTIVSQRVVEVWDHGTITRQTVERTFWRREG